MATEPSPPEPSARIKVHPDLLSTEVDKEVLIMSVDAGRYFGLDEIASDLWHRLEGAPTFDELVAVLREHYDGDPARIEQDTIAFIDTLREQGLVTIGE